MQYKQLLLPFTIPRHFLYPSYSVPIVFALLEDDDDDDNNKESLLLFEEDEEDENNNDEEWRDGDEDDEDCAILIIFPFVILFTASKFHVTYLRFFSWCL